MNVSVWVTEGRVYGWQAGFARMALIAGGLFAALLGALHVLEPEYDPTWRFISEYALGSYGWMMSLAFASLAVSLASTGLAALPHVRGFVGYLGLFVLAVAIVGICMAALFVTDPVTGAPGTGTESGRLHVIGASLDYTPVAALLISFALKRNRAWHPVRVALFVTAGITIAATVAFMAALPADYQFRPGVYTGLVGRILILSYLGWIFVVATHALRLRKAEAMPR